MVKYRPAIFLLLAAILLGFSFYPTYFELQRSQNLKDLNREFILEHNYYWPDYNLYLSKIRQGTMGRWTALEKYTHEPHKGSLIQEFYVVLGQLGRVFSLEANGSYLLGRILLSPLLYLVVIMLCMYYFRSAVWSILAAIIVYVSGSFPRFYTDELGTHVGRYMEWWSNIDATQRITFIPHILFGQITSFFLLFSLTTRKSLTTPKFILYILLGNLTGLVFPPSLMTLQGVLGLLILIQLFGKLKHYRHFRIDWVIGPPAGGLGYWVIFIVGTLPVLFYFILTTKQIPWIGLVDFHRNHPMMIPFDQYVLGTGPVFFLGMIGAVVSILNRDKKFQPLLLWVTVTFLFAALFSVVNEQSPLRFTQTGLFIPLGILTTYLFYSIWNLVSNIQPQGPASSVQHPTSQQTKYVAQTVVGVIIFLYILGNTYMMYVGLRWQTTWLTQKINASIPLVPYPPIAMYPLRDWIAGIRWLKDNTRPEDVVVAAVTAGNHIPAYSGNTVYFGQANTVDYERKQLEVDRFFKGDMSPNQAKLFLSNPGIKYIFFSIQEREQANGKDLKDFYPFLKPVYTNPIVIIYSPS